MGLRTTKALGLLSGGLDSILAVKVIQQQGIEVVGLTFTTPFFAATMARNAADDLNIRLIVQDITDEHFEIVKHPPHGYGKAMNPCIDCHILMLKVAGRVMEREKFDFIFSGEVLDERPMSQNTKSLNTIAALSGYEHCIVRPLSARLLPLSEPEKRGFVDRKRLLDIRGRSRKRQIAMAEEFGVKAYPNPAGGCLLTDKEFSKRLKELLTVYKNPQMRDVRLLSVGRHFRFSDSSKLIVGRDMRENQLLRTFYTGNDVILTADKVPGPLCLLTGPFRKGTLERAARICASYSDAKQASRCPVRMRSRTEESRITVTVDKEDRNAMRIN